MKAETKDNLEALRTHALARGASDAVIIPTSDVIVDPRVRIKCLIPLCYMALKCNHCPPDGYSTQEIREMVSSYRWAVFFRVKVKSSIIAARNNSDYMSARVFDPKGNLFNLGGHYILVLTITKILQKKASALGYAKTVGFAAGTCREFFCHFQPGCQKLMTGKSCRHLELSSPSMESCGMDVFTMAARAGWDMYPIGGRCRPKSVGRGNLCGLVLVT